MRKKYFIFLVDTVVKGDPGRVTVLGRGGDYPIPVGAEFDRIIRYRARKLPEEAGLAPIREAEEVVSLKVVCVHAYQHSLPELGEGMTGSLVLEGDGIDLVTPDWVLGTFDDNLPRLLPANSFDQSIAG